MRLIVFIFSLLLATVGAILDGDVISWDRHQFLVKVISKSHDDVLKSCSGVLITRSLVLTATDCVLDSVLFAAKEIHVFLNVRNSSRRELAVMLDRDDRWAALKIAPVDIEKLCPPSPEVKAIKRLNLNPNLQETSLVEVSPEEIMTEEFFTTVKTLRLELEPLRGPDEKKYYRSNIVNNFTACFDDPGAPVLCETTAHGEMLIGHFQKMGVLTSTLEDMKPRKFTDNTENCALAKEMIFFVLQQQQLPSAID
ncbi:Peptidase S1 domain-containing protein [Aphelenchoides besseyi]|nr:Peptidase S1 domain-containing protein [Aphelenchoides besseyi]